VLNHTAGEYGDAAIAAMAVVQRIGMFAMSGLVGFGQGFQPVCGFNYGARRYDRVKRAFWFCVKTSSVVLVLMAAAAVFFAPEIIALFRGDDPDVIRIGALAMRCQAVMFPTMGWFFLNNMLLQTVGCSGRASLLALARQGLFLMPILLLLTPRMGILAIQMAQPLADVGTVTLSLFLGLGVLRRMPSNNQSGRFPAAKVEEVPEAVEEL
jgi:Na+-driven multidrug efflux pump